MKKKVIVCGTRFGQFYIEALKNMEEVELVGILAHGSERSKKCAEYYGLPLFTDIKALPEDIEIACVAVKAEVMGGNGSELSMELMKKGIHVIFEQPMHLKGTAECLRYAQTHQLKFIIGNLYKNLPAVKNFIENVRKLSQREKPLYVNVDFATQVSYPLIHILLDIMPTLRNWKVVGEVKEAQPFQSLVLVDNGTEIIFRAHNEIDKKDMDGYLHLLFQISVGYTGGRVTLLDPHGPVIWQPRIHFPKEDIIPAKLSDISEGSMTEQNTVLLYERNETQKQLFSESWPKVIAEDVRVMVQMIEKEDRAAENQRVQKQLLRCQLWQQFMQMLGYPQIVERSPYVYVPLNTFKQDVDKQEEKSVIKNGILQLNRACQTTMLYQLQKNLTESELTFSCKMEIIIEKMAIKKEFNAIIWRWFRTLEESDYLTIVEDRCYFEIGRISEHDVEAAWAEAEKDWDDDKMGAHSIYEYFKSNAVHLEKIMKGELNAAYLLFPEGSFDLARDLYSTTAIAVYLNQTIAKTIAQMNGIESKKILEIGAGTGSTTVQVCKELVRNKGCKEYLFSDVSDFFLIEAKKKFDAYPWMTYQKIDIDNSFEVSEQKDIVVAVGVINNSENIQEVLKRIWQVLKPEGYLFLVEAVGESVTMLISQAFMMEKTIDERQSENMTFLGMKQWYQLFEVAGYQVVTKVPDRNSELTVYNQKLFVLQKKERESL